MDGIVGSGTRKAINDCNLEKDRVKAYRIKYYCDLVNKKPEQERFFYGWVRRSIRGIKLLDEKTKKQKLKLIKQTPRGRHTEITVSVTKLD